MKKILIIGKNSYVGKSLESWLGDDSDRYTLDSISVRDDSWRRKDFSDYDVVFHVAAMVHQKERPEMENLYYEINRDLPVEVAKRAKEAGVKQFIFMSTMAVYGEEGRIDQEVVITRETRPNPKTFYGKSKFEAECELQKLSNEGFKIVITRPPMIYGPNCPGNYGKLEKLAKKIIVFPMIQNERSMIHIDELCKCLKVYIDINAEGIFLPQDNQYVNTSILVKKLAEESDRKIYLSKFLGWLIVVFMRKRPKVIKKVFGNLVYDNKTTNK